MLDFIFWYLIVTALGWIVFPIIFQLVPNLPGRGFSFSKLLGLLLWGYLYWILGRLGITANNQGGLFFTLFMIIFLSVLAYRNNREERGKWFRENRSLILIVEALFLVAFCVQM